MARVALVLKPDDYPGTPDEKTVADIKALFEHMMPGVPNPEIPGTASAFGVVAQDPVLALLLVKVSDHITRQMSLTSGRRDLRELMVATLNYHFRCDFSFLSHLKPAAAAGISPELIASVPFWRTTNVFDEEQRLVIEFTSAAVTGDVPEELFDRVKAWFGERQAIELSVGVGWWSMWAMIIGATRPTFDFGLGRPAT